jgi:PHD finger-like domain-containing protein 5A
VVLSDAQSKLVKTWHKNSGSNVVINATCSQDPYTLYPGRVYGCHLLLRIYDFEAAKTFQLLMSRHQYDLIQCMKRPGTHIGMLCLLCDGRCPICDSFVKPAARVRICDECGLGHMGNKCIVCGNGLGVNSQYGSVAYYCLECVQMEKDREGCPRITNVGSSKSDMIAKRRRQN